MSGLQLRPLDLARLGQLALDDGQIQGRSLIDPAWMRMSTAAATGVTDRIGLLWWTLPAWTRYTVMDDHVRDIQAAGADSEQVERLRSMVGTYPSRTVLLQHLDLHGLIPPLIPAGVRWMTEESGRQVGFRHDGWLGQHLIVHREARMVGVRLIDRKHPQVEAEGSHFDSFIDRFVELATASI